MSARVWSILSNGQKLDGGAMFGNAPRVMWEKWIAPDELGRIPLACRCLLVEIQGQRLLFETGIGAFFSPEMGDRYGVQNPGTHLLLENLAAAGFKEEDIDAVVLSHLHFDHAGGLLPAYQPGQTPSRLLFPKAQYLVGRSAVERARKPHSRDRASFIPELLPLLEASGRLVVVDEDHASHPWSDVLEFVVSEGHTPGQMHAVVKLGATRIFFAGDLIPGVPWVHVPITMGYDRYPERLIDEKQALLDRAEAEGWWVFFTHDNDVCAVQVRRNPKGRFEALNSANRWEGLAI